MKDEVYRVACFWLTFPNLCLDNNDYEDVYDSKPTSLAPEVDQGRRQTKLNIINNNTLFVEVSCLEFCWYLTVTST